MEFSCDRAIIWTAQRLSNITHTLPAEKRDRHELFDLRLFRQAMYRGKETQNRPRSSRRFRFLG